MTRAAAIGFSVHTGWAAAVAVAGPTAAPRVIANRQIRLFDTTEAAQLYHHAADAPPARAGRLVEAGASGARQRARDAIAALAGETGTTLAAAGVIVGNRTELPPLEVIMRSHAMVHTAEGVLYRNVFADAARSLDLRVVTCPAAALAERAAAALRCTAAELDSLIAEAGKIAGRPWTADQKRAFLVACLARARRA